MSHTFRLHSVSLVDGFIHSRKESRGILILQTTKLWEYSGLCSCLNLDHLVPKGFYPMFLSLSSQPVVRQVIALEPLPLYIQSRQVINPTHTSLTPMLSTKGNLGSPSEIKRQVLSIYHWLSPHTSQCELQNVLMRLAWLLFPSVSAQTGTARCCRISL